MKENVALIWPPFLILHSLSLIQPVLQTRVYKPSFHLLPTFVRPFLLFFSLQSQPSRDCGVASTFVSSISLFSGTFKGILILKHCGQIQEPSINKLQPQLFVSSQPPFWSLSCLTLLSSQSCSFFPDCLFLPHTFSPSLFSVLIDLKPVLTKFDKLQLIFSKFSSFFCPYSSN